MGTYLWAFGSKKALISRDLTGDGLQEIISLTTDGGAGLGAFVRVFRLNHGKLIFIAPPDAEAHSLEIVPVSNKTEMIFYGK